MNSNIHRRFGTLSRDMRRMSATWLQGSTMLSACQVMMRESGSSEESTARHPNPQLPPGPVRGVINTYTVHLSERGPSFAHAHT